MADGAKEVEMVDGEVGKSSSLSAVYNVVCCIVGAGVLGIPYAIAKIGWAGAPLVLICGVWGAYTGILLGRCTVYDPSLKTYGDIGMKAMGWWGKFIVVACQVGTCVGAGILYIVLAGQNFHQLFENLVPQMGVSVWMVISGVLALPLTYFKTMHELAIMSLFGVLTSVLTVIVVIIETFINPINANHSYGGVDFQGVLTGFATIVFAYGGHAIFPSIQRVMRTKRNFGFVVIISLIVAAVLYLMIGIIGYWQFGQTVSDSIFKNLDASRPLVIISIALVTIHVILAVSVLLNPIFLMIENSIQPPAETQACCPDEKPENCATEECRRSDERDGKCCSCWYKFTACLRNMPELMLRLTVRCTLVAICTLIAVIIPFFGDLMAFIGATTIAGSSFVLPTLFYFLLHRNRMHIIEKITCLFLTAFGGVVGVIAAVLAIISIVNNASKWQMFS